MDELETVGESKADPSNISEKFHDDGQICPESAMKNVRHELFRIASGSISRVAGTGIIQACASWMPDTFRRMIAKGKSRTAVPLRLRKFAGCEPAVAERGANIFKFVSYVGHDAVQQSMYPL